MTGREKEILEAIKKNPMISQKELADALGITRSSAAVHITNLLKKGYIQGKGYILNEEDYVCVLGGANMDIQGFPDNEFIPRDSNPGEVKISLGGVGRNIAENLAKLSVKTKLITAIGDDVYGNKILDEARNVGLDMSDAFIFKGENTSSYLSVLDHTGDMIAAIAHMAIYEKVSIELLKGKSRTIENAKICVIDTNIPKDTIEYVLTNIKGPKYFLDTVSSTKAKKIKDMIGSFHTIKPNRIETEMLTGIKITGEADVKKAAEVFLKKGVKNVFITLGEEGLFYANAKNSGFLKQKKIEVINATGAGDAFVAGLAYADFNDFDIEKAAKFARAASILALSHEATINPNMSVENINKKVKELELC